MGPWQHGMNSGAFWIEPQLLIMKHIHINNNSIELTYFFSFFLFLYLSL